MRTRKERYEYYKEYGLPLWVVKNERDTRMEKATASAISLVMLMGAFYSDDPKISFSLICMMVVAQFVSIWR